MKLPTATTARSRCRARRPHPREPTASGSVGGAVYREIPLEADQGQPEAAPSALRRGRARRAGTLHPRVRAHAADRGPRAGPRHLRAGHGRAAAAVPPSAPSGQDPRDRPADGRRGDAAGRAAGEHPPRAAQPARRGGRLPAAARGVRGHARRARVPHRAQPAGHHQHDPAAEAPPRRPAPGGGRRAVGRARRARCSVSTTPVSRRSWRPGSSPKGCRCGPPRRRWCSSKNAGPPKPKPAPRKPIQAPGLQDVADRLSNTFDTRVKVELGHRKGKIVVEFGSVDDLERIVEMMSKNGANRTRGADEGSP